MINNILMLYLHLTLIAIYFILSTLDVSKYDIFDIQVRKSVCVCVYVRGSDSIVTFIHFTKISQVPVPNTL